MAVFAKGKRGKGDRERNTSGENGKSGEPLRHRYVSRFIIYSTIAILIIGALLGWFLADSIRHELVEAYGLATAAQVNAAVNSFLSLDDLKTPLKGKRYKEFRKNVDAITAGTSIVEVKIWRPDGTVIFSKNREQVGKKFTGNARFNQAMKGEPAFIFSDLSEPEQEEQREKNTNLVEVYYPLRLGKGNQVDGVFEIYLSTAPIRKHTGRALRYLAVGMGSLAFLLIVFAQVSSRFLRNSNDHLAGLTSELEQKTTDLKQSEEKWRAIAETANDAIISMNMKGQIISWNPAAEKIFGYSSKEVLGKNMTMLMPERWHKGHEQAVAKIAAGNASRLSGQTLELTALRKNSDEFPITLSLAESKTHKTHTFIGMISDITERKKNESALKESEQRFRTLIENSSECICRLDLNGNLLFMNQAGLRFRGMTEVSEIIGKYAADMVEPEYRDEFARMLEKARNGETVRFQHQTRTGFGLRWFETVLSPQRDNLGKVENLIGLSADITERKIGEEKLKYLSTHDQLTGLYNHGTFFDFLKQEVERSKRHGRRFSLLMLDLDHFKKVNDTFGHHVGDTVLSEVAARMKRACRNADIVSRYGGEEFTVIMPETDLESALKGAERIRCEVGGTPITHVGDQAVSITVSIGVATFPEDTSNGQELVELADTNLYAAKESGRDRINWGSQAA